MRMLFKLNHPLKKKNLNQYCITACEQSAHMQTNIMCLTYIFF